MTATLDAPRAPSKTLLDYVPRDFLQLRFRTHDLAEDDAQVRETARTLAASSYVEFINMFCWTYNPRQDPKHFPFVLFEGQERMIDWCQERLEREEDGIMPKSRDMGVTWGILAWVLWHWLYTPGFSALLGSYTEDLVDDLATTSSMFGRLDYMLLRLPWWLLPDGFDRGKHRKKLTLVNPENGNTIEGQSSTADWGRGKRFTVMLADEIGFWEECELVDEGTADSSNTRFFVSTVDPFGRFWELLKSNRYPAYWFNWRDHPLKDDAWYADQVRRRGEKAVARELDISFEGSPEGKVYPTFTMIPKGPEYRYNGWWPLYCSWDYGLDDSTALTWYANRPGTPNYQIVDAYDNQNKRIDFYVPIVTGLPRANEDGDYGPRERAIIERHADWPPAVHFGDPAGKQRNQVTNSSVIMELQDSDITVITNPKMNNMEVRIGMTREFLTRVEGIATPECDLLVELISMARWPERSRRNQAMTPVRKPRHDRTSHYRTSLEYMAVNDPKSKLKRRSTRIEVEHDMVRFA